MKTIEQLTIEYLIKTDIEEAKKNPWYESHQEDLDKTVEFIKNKWTNAEGNSLEYGIPRRPEYQIAALFDYIQVNERNESKFKILWDKLFELKNEVKNRLDNLENK